VNILHKVRRLEADMTRAVERAAQHWSKSGSREPLEIAQAIVDAVGERLEPAARGRYVFPFNRIHVSIVAATKDVRARFMAVFDSEPTLRERIVARLRDGGCDPSGITLAITYVAQASSTWTTPEFHVDFARGPRTETVPVEQSARDLRITIVRGTAEKPSYVFSLPRVNLGRCAEVRDSLSRLVRTNHVAFVEGPATDNHTVSRRHAHIEYVEVTRQYRIRDDRSAQGTSIVRNGRTLTVPAGARGLRLESGDEIILGEARARVRIGGA
jgi:hypothetical protein